MTSWYGSLYLSTLSISWDYWDADSDTNSTPRIRWYRDGIIDNSLDDLLSINPGNTSKGEDWYFTIQVYDSFPDIIWEYL